MENEFLFELVEEYIKVHNTGPRKWNFHTFWYWKNIPPKRLKQARKYFAPYDDRLERPLLVMSDNVFGKLFSGIFISNLKFYYNLNLDEGMFLPILKKGAINLADMNSIDIQYPKKSGWLLVNGEKEAVIARYSAGMVDEGEAIPFKNAVNHVLKALHKGKPDD